MTPHYSGVIERSWLALELLISIILGESMNFYLACNLDGHNYRWLFTVGFHRVMRGSTLHGTDKLASNCGDGVLPQAGTSVHCYTWIHKAWPQPGLA
jgi:hypothetical protein